MRANLELHRRPDLHLGGAARPGRGRPVPRGRVRAGPGGGDGDLADRRRRSGRRCGRTRPPARAWSWTRPGWTRCAARSGTSSGSARSSTASRRCGDAAPGCRGAAASWRPARLGPGPPLAHCRDDRPRSAPASLLGQGPRPVRSCPAGRCCVVASDRISAYDHVLPTPIPDKGRILTQLSLWWFERLADLVPHHLVSTRPGDPGRVRGRAMARASGWRWSPVECVARGYLAGSGWPDYRRDGAVCGVPLPPGLDEGARLPEPIFTPATKAPRGEHDENIPVASGGRAWWAALLPPSWNAHAGGLPARRGIAARGGILLADTKLEFGCDARGRLTAGRRGAHARTRPASGRPTAGGRAARSPRTTSSSCATG